jgi:hypothetical protein
MLKILSSMVVISAFALVQMPQANASLSASSLHKTKEKISKKPAQKPESADEADEKEADTNGAASIDFSCELGNKLTIYQNSDDAKHIRLRWKKHLHLLTRVDTTTGANRFENQHFGLVWIGIPAKGILLDSKKGLQLANECKNSEQQLPNRSENTSQPKS